MRSETQNIASLQKEIVLENFSQDIDTLTIKFALAAVLLPLLAFVINMALPGKRKKLAGWVSTLAILTGGVLSVFVFASVWNGHQVHQSQLWFTIGANKVYGGILLNNLSVLMLLLVNLIALPVHIYSIAYMNDDEGFKRYFAYLSFFCFSMLALVVADNLGLFVVPADRLLVHPRQGGLCKQKGFRDEQDRGYGPADSNHNSVYSVRYC